MAYEQPSDGNIRATLALSQEEARTGSSRVLNLPGGRRVTVTIPPHTRDGEEIRLRGQGEPVWQGGPVGDLILTINIPPSTSYPGFGTPYDSVEPTEFVPAPSYPPSVSSPNNRPAGFPSNPNFPATMPAAPGFAENPPRTQPQPQEQIYLPHAQPSNSPPTQIAYPQAGQQYVPTLPPQPQTPQRRGLSGGAIALIIFLVVLLLVGSGLIYYAGVYQPQQAHIQATATANSQLTGTAQAIAQSTQFAQATAQAVASATTNAQATANAQASATATALQNIYTQATGGTPILNDNLSANSSNQWNEIAGACTFTGGTYHSTVTQKGFFQPCFAQAPTFTNFAFQVDMTIVSGDEGGIIFRADPVNSRFYLLQISQNGSYALYLYTSSNGSQAKSLLSNSSSLINKGLNQTNTITVVANGSNLYIYINKQFLDAVSDSTYTSGNIGVFAESNLNPTDVAFANAQVWQI